MLRSVPGGMSPVCTGTTVWQRPQRTIKCDPLCRASSHPRRRSNARSSLVRTV